MHFLFALLHFIIGTIIIHQSSTSPFRDFCLECILASGLYIVLWIVCHFLFGCDNDTKQYVCCVQVVLWTLLLTPLGLYLIGYNNEWEIEETLLLIFFEINMFVLLLSCLCLIFVVIQKLQ